MTNHYDNSYYSLCCLLTEQDQRHRLCNKCIAWFISTRECDFAQCEWGEILDKAGASSSCWG